MNDDPQAIALLGDSRMQLGLAPDVIRARRPGRVVAQLAIVGRPPVAVLEDLAADPGFVGTALVALRAEHLEGRYMPGRPQAEVAHYHDVWQPAARWPYHDAAQRLRLHAALASRLAVLAPSLGVDPLVRAALERRRPAPQTHVVMSADRSMRGDYTLVDASERARGLERLAAKRRGPSAAERRAWQRRAAGVRRAIAQIESRGGRVVLLRLPSSPARFESEERLHPRVAYWDTLVEGTNAVALHYRDEPALAAIVPADSAHVDRRDAPRFTRALLEALERRGVFDAEQATPSRIAD